LYNCLTCKCEYVNVADPCKVCREKGLRCIASDKVWGKARRSRQAAQGDREEIQLGDGGLRKEDDGIEDIPRQPHGPDENILRPLDGILLQFYMEKIDRLLQSDMYTYETTPPEDWYVNRAGRPEWHFASFGHDVFQRFGPMLPSISVRYAILLLSLRSYGSFYSGTNLSLLKMEYKDRFYQAMRKAIDVGAYTDVLYASYFTCLGRF